MPLPNVPRPRPRPQCNPAVVSEWSAKAGFPLRRLRVKPVPVDCSADVSGGPDRSRPTSDGVDRNSHQRLKHPALRLPRYLTPVCPLWTEHLDSTAPQNGDSRILHGTARNKPGGKKKSGKCDIRTVLSNRAFVPKKLAKFRRSAQKSRLYPPRYIFVTIFGVDSHDLCPWLCPMCSRSSGASLPRYDYVRDDHA